MLDTAAWTVLVERARPDSGVRTCTYAGVVPTAAIVLVIGADTALATYDVERIGTRGFEEVTPEPESGVMTWTYAGVVPTATIVLVIGVDTALATKEVDRIEARGFEVRAVADPKPESGVSICT